MKYNILIVEDHELTRFGLKTTFENVDFVENIYEADSAETAIQIFNNNKIDIVVMDLGLPNMNGIEATKQIRSSNKDVKIIILTSHNDEKEVLNSLKAGANAYCSKEINPQRLVEVVNSVADGAAWFDPSIAHIVLKASANSPSSTRDLPLYSSCSSLNAVIPKDAVALFKIGLILSCSCRCPPKKPPSQYASGLVDARISPR